MHIDSPMYGKISNLRRHYQNVRGLNKKVTEFFRVFRSDRSFSVTGLSKGGEVL